MLAQRNTEYPFQVSAVVWEAPSSESVFEKNDVKRYVFAAEQIVGGLQKLATAIELLTGL